MATIVVNRCILLFGLRATTPKLGSSPFHEKNFGLVVAAVPDEAVVLGKCFLLIFAAVRSTAPTPATLSIQL